MAPIPRPVLGHGKLLSTRKAIFNAERLSFHPNGSFPLAIASTSEFTNDISNVEKGETIK